MSPTILMIGTSSTRENSAYGMFTLGITLATFSNDKSRFLMGKRRSNKIYYCLVTRVPMNELQCLKTKVGQVNNFYS